MLARLGQRWLTAHFKFSTHPGWLVPPRPAAPSLPVRPPPLGRPFAVVGEGGTQQREYWTWAEEGYRPLTSVEMKPCPHTRSVFARPLLTRQPEANKAPSVSW